MYVSHAVTERAINTRVFAAAAGEEFGQAKLPSGSVPLEVDVLKPTLPPVTASLIQL